MTGVGGWRVPALRGGTLASFQGQPHHGPARPAAARRRGLYPQGAGQAPRRGTTAPPGAAGWIVESLDDIVAMVGDAQLHVKSWRGKRSAGDAKLLGLPAKTGLHCLQKHPRARQRPYARSIIYFPPAVGSRLSREAFDDTVVFRVAAARARRPPRRRATDDLGRTRRPRGCRKPAMRDRRAASRHAAPLPERRATLVEIAYSRSLASEARLSTRLDGRDSAQFLTSLGSQLL